MGVSGGVHWTVQGGQGRYRVAIGDRARMGNLQGQGMSEGGG